MFGQEASVVDSLVVSGLQKVRHASGRIVSVLVLGACLSGCAYWESNEETLASQVEFWEGGDVEVTSCEKVGEAVTRDSEHGASLEEAWRCSLHPHDGSPATDACYAAYTLLEVGVISRLNCSLLGPGCPPRGRRAGEGTVFLGPVIEPDLVLERARGNDPPHRRIRVDVSRDANGVRKRCGYLVVQLPMDVEDPLKQAAERVEGLGWSEDRYSFSSRSLDG
jgi:hypothetical protein